MCGGGCYREHVEICDVLLLPPRVRHASAIARVPPQPRASPPAPSFFPHGIHLLFFSHRADSFASARPSRRWSPTASTRRLTPTKRNTWMPWTATTLPTPSPPMPTASRRSSSTPVRLLQPYLEIIQHSPLYDISFLYDLRMIRVRQHERPPPTYHHPIDAPYLRHRSATGTTAGRLHERPGLCPGDHTERRQWHLQRRRGEQRELRRVR